MFISTDKKVPIHNVGQEMARRDVSTGHVFRYTPSSGEGYLYAHLDEYHNVYYALKFPRNAKENTTSTALNFTSTPIHSSRVDNRVEIVGHFEFNVELDQTLGYPHSVQSMMHRLWYLCVMMLMTKVILICILFSARLTHRVQVVLTTHFL